MLSINHLMGFGSEQSATPLTLTYIGRELSESDTDEYTFADEPIGTAASDRLVVVVVWAAGPTIPSPGNAPTSVAIGGNNATIHESALGLYGSSLSVASLVVPTGTTATIVVTMPVGQLQCAILVYTVTGYSNATPTTDSIVEDSGSESATLSVTVGNNQVGLAASSILVGGGSVSAVWTNATEDVDVGFADQYSYVSSASLATGSGTLDRTCTWSAPSLLTMVSAVWS
jgi:hypothetical protein